MTEPALSHPHNQPAADRESKGRYGQTLSRPDGSLLVSPRASILWLTALACVLLVAAWLRWRYIVHVQPYPDEFVTLLTVKMILQKGVPILPSGLFYEHGLLFSYVAAAASALAGFSRNVVRATSMVFGLLTVLLTWQVGRRWFSTAAGLVAATMLAVAPTAVLWGGRARMYALLELWVLLTLYFALRGSLADRPAWRRLALACTLGAVLSHFVAIALLPPLVVATLAAGWLAAHRRGEPAWFKSRRIWLEVAGLGAVTLIAFIVKRAGQPKGVAPLEASGVGLVTGLLQVATIYGDVSADVTESWRALSPFFLAPAALLPTALALLAVVWAGANWLRHRAVERDLATLFLALVLSLTTLEMFFLVAPERRDDKYLFMLQPALLLLAADGLTRLGSHLSGRFPISNLRSQLAGLAVCIGLVVYAWPATWDVVSQAGSDYDSAFGYVRDHWQAGDTVLTGTPAAAGIYLGRNDYYAVRGTGGYAYRILERDGKLVERWMGSPWLQTDQDLHTVLAGPARVWLVLERWGLIKEYYAPLTMQRILAMTDFVREDNGIIVLRSRPGAPLIPEHPSVQMQQDFGDQARLVGYDLAWENGGSSDEGQQAVSLTLYWQALRPLPYDYTVFVHVRDAQGRTVAQADHQPLAPIYPPTLWPVGQTIRERSVFMLPGDLPAGDYDVWIGLYRLDTLDRVPVMGDVSGENAVLLGRVVVP
jgi:4-amino-4-deoxy-L-arabinose transferase-like glycosyltransferase